MEAQQDLLTDLEETIWYRDATAGTRLLNFIVDIIFIVLLVIVTQVVFFPEFATSPLGERILFMSFS